MTTSCFVGRIEKLSDVRARRLTNPGQEKSPQLITSLFVCLVQIPSMNDNDVVLGAAFKGLDASPTALHLSQSLPAMDDEEYHHMDLIISGLWIGDLHSATDSDALTANNIRSILTMMRGRFSVPEVRPILLLTSISTSLTRTASTTDLHPSANSAGRRGRR